MPRKILRQEIDKQTQDTLDALDAGIDPGKKEDEVDLRELTAAKDVAKSKKKKKLHGFTNWRVKAGERAKKKEADKKAAKDAADAKAEEEKKEVEAELARLEKEAENMKVYEDKKWRLEFKINFYIEEINAIDDTFADKMNKSPEEEIPGLIEPEETDATRPLKIKLAACLKELGSMKNLRESVQIERINEYVKTLREAGTIMGINKYVNDDDKLPEDINLEDKKCEPYDSIEECQAKLSNALALFATFEEKMQNTLKGQQKKVEEFKQLGIKAEEFKKAFRGWIEEINTAIATEKPIDALTGLKTKIEQHPNDELNREDELKKKMADEIGILIQKMEEYNKFKEDLKVAEEEQKKAQVKLDALKEAETRQQVEEAAKEEEQRVQKDKGGDGDGQVVVAKTNKPVEDETVDEVDTSAKTDETVEEGETVDTSAKTDEEVVASKTDKPVEGEVGPVKQMVETIENRPKEQKQTVAPSKGVAAQFSKPKTEGMSKDVDSGETPPKGNPKVVGGRKKKSRRRKKSKKRKSKKNRR